MRKKWMRVLLAAGLSGTLAIGSAVAACAGTTAFSSATGGENALSAAGTYEGITVTKSGDSSDENADFTGSNAAVLAASGTTITLKNSTITTSGSHANAVFACGGTINISDSQITTTGNNSGGLMTTSGGTMNATDLTIDTSGNSSAAIRSDRGGGTVTVDEGTYSTTGVGSPAIYSTADITVKNADLSSDKSEAVVIEGGNSVDLENCTVTGSNTVKNGQAQTFQNVMLYQSMSGDASEGSSTFTMNGGSMTAKNGAMFYVTNTTSTINLSDTQLTLASGGVLLDAAQGPWGSSGSNGGQVTLNARKQTLTGDITVDAGSAVNLILSGGSSYTGTINGANTDGKIYVEVPSGTTWTLTGDSYATSLTCAAGSINLNGHSLYVNGTKYTAGSASTGSAVTKTSTGSSGGQNGNGGGNGQNGNGNGNGSGQNGSGNGQNGGGQQPPARPDDVKLSFTDVSSSAYYYDAVLWAASRQITSGKTSTTFDPTGGCTRAQMVTFLYRYFNRQAPTAPGNTDSSTAASSSSSAAASTVVSKFTDVSSKAYYAEALAWAVKNNITAGTSATTFDPDRTCTRAEAITFLYRATKLAGSVSTGTSSAKTFTDVPSGAYYAQAVSWASANGITSGTTAKTFSPKATVTRAQVVAFLYRLDQKTRPQPGGGRGGMTPPDQNSSGNQPPALPQDNSGTASSTAA